MTGWGPRVSFGSGGGGTDPDLPDLPFSEYSEQSVTANSNGTIIDFTASPGYLFHLIRVEFGGQNIGEYSLLINDILEAKFVTWFNGPMDSNWDFSVPTFGGLPLAAETNIKVNVLNNRPDDAVYFARIIGLTIEF